MSDLFALFLSLTVFGIGVTIIDFIGIFDNTGSSNDSGSADDSAGADDSIVNVSKSGSNLVPENKQKNPEKTGFKIISKIMSFLRNIVYFSLGFGPTGLFAVFKGLPKTSGLVWSLSAGIAVMILARFLKRFFRKDLDSSIKPDDLLQENGVLLLPLEGGEISKAAVRQYGREIEIYVRCRDLKTKLPKGKEIIIEEYDNEVYWIKPVE
ncbi:MAG: hypothetical protein FWC22_04975 [Treponema sp.]|nr:hypothetical protein [Treponema sp.]